jgi:predicted PurR-regulated permease PerM
MDVFLARRFTSAEKKRYTLLMDPVQHLRITGGALKNWIIAQAQDSLAVGLLWLVGLYVLHVPWAPFWAFLAAVFQFVPHLGPVLGMLGPVLAATVRWQDWEHPLYVLILYAIIVVVDGLALQPYIMKRTAKVPIWASIVTPIVLGILWPFWGVLVAPPLLAVLYAYKRHNRDESINRDFR